MKHRRKWTNLTSWQYWIDGQYAFQSLVGGDGLPIAYRCSG